MRYNDYDSFADVYNRHWGEFGVRVVEPLDRLGLADLAPGSRVLDLCCGTGQLAALLSERGLDVVGVDGSEAMIAFATENAPQAHFLVADAREFAVDDPASMVVSTFDSLNHIMSLDELTDAFRCAFRALVPGGKLVFDLNMESGYVARWHGSFVLDADGEFLTSQSSYDADARIGEMAFTWFATDGPLWRRHDLTLTQRCYEEPEVLGALESVGFADTSATDAADLVDTWQPGRTFFSATRP